MVASNRIIRFLGASIANYPLPNQLQRGFEFRESDDCTRRHLFRHGMKAVHVAKSTKKRTLKTILKLLDLEQSKSAVPEQSHLAELSALLRSCNP
jgi:hypothetical protein